MHIVKISNVDALAEAEACHWAWKNCLSFIGWKLIEDNKVIEFKFKSEHDALMFTLMWAK
jgi:hypothetical protein